MSTPCSVDLDQPMSCRDTLSQLWAIYMDVLAGSRARVRFGTRWSEYHLGNVEGIRTAYMSIYAGCPDVAGLPNLAKGRQMQRGAPGIVPNAGTFERRRVWARGPDSGVL
jgi:hypothetical protein